MTAYKPTNKTSQLCGCMAAQHCIGSMHPQLILPLLWFQSWLEFCPGRAGFLFSAGGELEGTLHTSIIIMIIRHTFLLFSEAQSQHLNLFLSIKHGPFNKVSGKYQLLHKNQQCAFCSVISNPTEHLQILLNQLPTRSIYISKLPYKN